MTAYSLYGDTIKLDFNDKKHVYTVDDTPVESVTGITKIIDKSGPLMWWAVGEALKWVQENMDGIDLKDEVDAKDFWNLAQRAHLRSSQKAADIGTLAHEWIEQRIEGAKPAIPHNKKLRATVQSWLKWQRDVGLRAEETEFKVYSKRHNFAGTCDFDGYVDGERAIVDWKTSKKVYPEHGIQVAAYQMAREEELGIQYAARYVVALPKDGGDVVVKRWGPEEYEKQCKAFLGALDLVRGLKK